MKSNPISTFPPYYPFHIGEVIQIWLARLMRWDLGCSLKEHLFYSVFTHITIILAYLQTQLYYTSRCCNTNSYIKTFYAQHCPVQWKGFISFVKPMWQPLWQLQCMSHACHTQLQWIFSTLSYLFIHKCIMQTCKLGKIKSFHTLYGRN